ncbi:MAG: Uracil-DNA glycosylase [Microgenomates group bacterium GW2011_GWC1_46_16]|nr:MAG: Uracil-DNA glycosylase [Microgenomates group bacterium GW2011_GWF1_46_12]KKU26917.1 MAG: Uracil-DNA glycosylase [Microgenomates group bacterium GW2011_GWC1_46_16]KKU28334.1 MAG: Uracil-DNA glycosylase [Microgenomates group bacterium GW2011_GWF2_46_18]KKU45204.1 MAG: Uracil-DNA glycosylase [Microgenomates group bacterium GW2011_GWB1_46_7]KKU60546.1 MAG: Uracil-DNA glycosylase [Microgenomates group bacterium GW2011_GWD1_47_13]KKU62151.1 MAG: Uracil-DNA glycosylase [Microgenomates group b
MQVKIEPSWEKVLQKEFDKDYFRKLTKFVKSEYESATIYPPPRFIFRAFDLTPFDQVKVVILGQDPYHEPDQANGLCFSVNQGVKLPPSLQNIYKEIESDTGKPPSQKDGDLTKWAQQGVLLLNATLTVRAHQAGSHQNLGWEQFTDAVVRVLSQQKQNLVFILWGAYAQKKGAVIDESRHLVIRSAHPSPLSAHNGFFGSRPFSRCDTYLVAHGETPIFW